jgi:hypothetical protein
MRLLSISVFGRTGSGYSRKLDAVGANLTLACGQICSKFAVIYLKKSRLFDADF